MIIIIMMKKMVKTLSFNFKTMQILSCPVRGASPLLEIRKSAITRGKAVSIAARYMIP